MNRHDLKQEVTIMSHVVQYYREFWLSLLIFCSSQTRSVPVFENRNTGDDEK